MFCPPKRFIFNTQGLLPIDCYLSTSTRRHLGCNFTSCSNQFNWLLGVTLLITIFLFDRDDNCDPFWPFQELLDSKQRGRERLNRVQRCGAVSRDHTGSGGYEAMEREEAALFSSWDQWERGALQTRASLETALSQIASSEQEFSSLSAQLEQDLHDFSRQLKDWRLQLAQAEKKNEGEEAVKGWQIAKVGLGLV